MSIRIPQNIIVEAKYTIGKEYIFVNSYKEYQGYYYELNGKLFAGKEFNQFAPEIKKIEVKNINKFLTNASTFIYGIISGASTLNATKPFNSVSKTSSYELNGKSTYYVKKINEVPIKIKQVEEDIFYTLQKDPFYQTIILLPLNNNIDQAEQQMPGLKAFLGV